MYIPTYLPTYTTPPAQLKPQPKRLTMVCNNINGYSIMRGRIIRVRSSRTTTTYTALPYDIIMDSLGTTTIRRLPCYCAIPQLQQWNFLPDLYVLQWACVSRRGRRMDAPALFLKLQGYGNGLFSLMARMAPK